MLPVSPCRAAWVDGVTAVDGLCQGGDQGPIGLHQPVTTGEQSFDQSENRQYTPFLLVDQGFVGRGKQIRARVQARLCAGLAPQWPGVQRWHQSRRPHMEQTHSLSDQCAAARHAGVRCRRRSGLGCLDKNRRLAPQRVRPSRTGRASWSLPCLCRRKRAHRFPRRMLAPRRNHLAPWDSGRDHRASVAFLGKASERSASCSRSR